MFPAEILIQVCPGCRGRLLLPLARRAWFTSHGIFGTSTASIRNALLRLTLSRAWFEPGTGDVNARPPPPSAPAPSSPPLISPVHAAVRRRAISTVPRVGIARTEAGTGPFRQGKRSDHGFPCAGQRICLEDPGRKPVTPATQGRHGRFSCLRQSGHEARPT